MLPTRTNAAHDVVLPAYSINFVNVITGPDSYSVPVMNLCVQECTIRKGETTLRGEVERLPVRATSSDESDVILIEQLDIGKEQPQDVKEDLCHVLPFTSSSFVLTSILNS